MTSEADHHETFRRALEARNPTAAWQAAGKVDGLRLDEALKLVLLLARDEAEANRFGTASARWVARYTVERRATIHESALIASQFAVLQTPLRTAAATTLVHHFEARAQRHLAGVVREWA